MTKRPRPAGDGDVSESGNTNPPLLRRDASYRSSDGLRLHAADYGDPLSPWLPVVCLPGLARTNRDFHDLAIHLSTHRHRPRRVVAFDYRGRGRSERDVSIANYNAITEMNDILDGMTALGIARAVIVGTSRGGIIAMLMGVGRPGAIAGVVLNDIGPVIEARGLARLKTYVGRTPSPDDWTDAVAILQRLHGAQFTGLSDSDWMAFARATYSEEGGRPVIDYDPALARTFDGVDFDRPIPMLWNEFAALKRVPVLTLRGENSDIFSAETLVAMRAAYPGMEHLIIAGQGHAPLLRHLPLLQRISSFVTGVEGSGPPIDAFIPVARTDYDLDAAGGSDSGGS